MSKSLFAIAVALLSGSSALAVDIINRDATSHRVFVCGDGCKPDNSAPNRGFWISLAPGELKTNVCQAECVMLVADDDDLNPADLALAAEYSGSDVVAIKAGLINRD